MFTCCRSTLVSDEEIFRISSIIPDASSHALEMEKRVCFSYILIYDLVIQGETGMRCNGIKV